MSVQFMGVVGSECTETIRNTKKNKETERVAKRDDGTGVTGGKKKKEEGIKSIDMTQTPKGKSKKGTVSFLNKFHIKNQEQIR